MTDIETMEGDHTAAELKELKSAALQSAKISRVYYKDIRSFFFFAALTIAGMIFLNIYFGRDMDFLPVSGVLFLVEMIVIIKGVIKFERKEKEEYRAALASSYSQKALEQAERYRRRPLIEDYAPADTLQNDSIAAKTAINQPHAVKTETEEKAAGGRKDPRGTR